MSTPAGWRRWSVVTTALALLIFVGYGCSDESPTGPDAASETDAAVQEDSASAEDDDEGGEGEDPSGGGIATAQVGGGDTTVVLFDQGASGVANGALYREVNPSGSEGTGVLEPFLRLQASPEEAGINTSANNVLDNKDGSWTVDLPLNRMPRVDCPHRSGTCFELTLDVNEKKNVDPSPITLDMLVLYTAESGGVSVSDDFDPDTDAAAVGLTEFFDMDDGGDGNARVDINYALNAGSGQGDVRVFVPTSFLGSSSLDACPYDPRETTDCGTYFVLYSHFGGPEPEGEDGPYISDSGFEEWATRTFPFVTVEKTAVPSLTQQYDWDLDKSVDVASHSLLPTEEGTSDYTLSVTRDGPDEVAWSVEGTITITNPGDLDAEVESVADSIEGTAVDNLSCPSGTSGFTVPAGSSVECTYSHDFGEDPGDGTLTNTSTVTLASGTVFTATADFDFDEVAPENVTEENASATLTDDNFTSGDTSDDRDFGTFTESGEESYSVTFACDEDAGDHTNVATLDPVDADPITDSETVSVTCAELEVTKTAETSLTRTIDWTIDKSVSPDSWDLFTGDEGTSEYTVSVDSTGFTDSDWAVSGTITVENIGSVDVTLSDVTDEVNGSLEATVDCGVDFPYDLASGATLECDYERSLSSGDDGTNVATAHIQDNGTFSSDEVTFDFTDPVVTKVHDEINVTDDNGESWTASSDNSWTYTRTFACDGDGGTTDNTATIDETGQSAGASVTVNCYGLDVSKDASTSLTRTWDWSIQKDIDESVFMEGTFDGATNTATIGESESLLVEWDVALDASSTDSDWAVEGTITIVNNNPALDATLTDVSDVVSPDLAASVTCGTMTVPAGGSIDCTYSRDLPDGTTRTNTATATLQNQSFDTEDVGTDSGTTGFTGEAAVDFSTADITMVDKCVDVSDVLEEEGVEVGSRDLGTYCADQTLPETFDVQFTFGPEGSGADVTVECGDNFFDNTASFVTSDTGTSSSATSSITVSVECVEGCTLTQGYWKTHNESFKGGAPPDETWDLLADAEDTEFFTSGETWFKVFWTPPKGNVWYNLAHQYMAAHLNSLAGASAPPEVQDAMDYAEDYFFVEYETPQEAKKLKGNNPDRKDAMEAAGTLADYNEGEIGPGHCTENEEGTF